MYSTVGKTMPRDPWLVTGLALGMFLVLAALLGPCCAPFDPADMSFTPLSPPSPVHLLGVNDGGQDIFSELLYALRNTVVFGLLAAGAALAAGVMLGLCAAWFGGWFDMVSMRLAEVLLAVPSIMVLILLAALFRPSPTLLALVLAAMLWPTTAKAVRAQTLSLKEHLYVKAAVRMGGGPWYIMRRHLVPALFPLYLVGFAAKARAAMFMEVSLAFLGLFEPDRKSLGSMIGYALRYYYYDTWWNWLAPPVACLSLLLMSVTFLAVRMERVLDPRLRTP